MSQHRTIDFRYAPSSRWTSICRPDDPHKTLVDECGRLLYRYLIGRFQRVITFRVQTNRMPLEVRQETESAKVPVVRTTFVYPQVSLELAAFGHLDDKGRRTDVVIWTVRTAEPSFMTHFQVEAQDEANGFALEPSNGGSLVSLVPRAGDADKGARAVAFFSTLPLERGFAADYGPAYALHTGRCLVTPGKPFTGALFFPLNHADVSGFDLEWALRALEKERAYWNGLELAPLKLEIPDQDVADMVTSCARNILQAREIKDGIPEFQVGPAVYRGLWVVDGHFILEAAQFLGHAEEAAKGLQALRRRIREDGSITQLPFHIKETGIALLTLVRQCELAGDLSALNDWWPAVRGAVGYIRSLRERSKDRGPSAPEYGLMPPAYGDGGLAGKRPEYTTALWTLAGLKAVAEAARRLGHREDAEAFRAEFDDLLATFYEKAARDMRSLPDGTPYLPMLMPCGSERIGHPLDRESDERAWAGVPDEPWERINPATATWALAHSIFPGEVFSPDEPIVQNFCKLLDSIDDDEGVPTGTGWAPYQAVWNYSASFYAHVWLVAGRGDKAVDYLYAFANHAAPTRVWREEHSFRDAHHGYWVGDMPHNWASAEFIRLVRNLLVLERGDALEIFAGLPPEWVQVGRPIRVEKTPTRFGRITVAAEVGDGSFEVRLTREGNAARELKRCVLNLQAFEERGFASFALDGDRVEPTGGRLELPVDRTAAGLAITGKGVTRP